MKKTINALLIGAGSIGAKNDWHSKNVNSYAKAFYRDKEIDFNIYDPFSEDLNKIANYYRAGVLDKLQDKEIPKYDVIVIASPTKTHFNYLKYLINNQAKVIICEKPVSNTISEIEEIENIVKKFNGSILVNYHRNFQLQFITLKEKVRETLISQRCEMIVVEYQRGFNNNASHALILLEFLFNDYISFKNAKKVVEKFDDFADDPTITIFGKLGEYDLSVIGITNALYSHLNISLFFDKSIIRIYNAGDVIEIYSLNKDQFSLNRHLNLTNRTTNIMKDAMINVINSAKKLVNCEPQIEQFLSCCNLSKKIIKVGENHV